MSGICDTSAQLLIKSALNFMGASKGKLDCTPLISMTDKETVTQ